MRPNNCYMKIHWISFNRLIWNKFCVLHMGNLISDCMKGKRMPNENGNTFRCFMIQKKKKMPVCDINFASNSIHFCCSQLSTVLDKLCSNFYSSAAIRLNWGRVNDWIVKHKSVWWMVCLSLACVCMWFFAFCLFEKRLLWTFIYFLTAIKYSYNFFKRMLCALTCLFIAYEWIVLVFFLIVFFFCIHSFISYIHGDFL